MVCSHTSIHPFTAFRTGSPIITFANGRSLECFVNIYTCSCFSVLLEAPKARRRTASQGSSHVEETLPAGIGHSVSL